MLAFSFRKGESDAAQTTEWYWLSQHRRCYGFPDVRPRHPAIAIDAERLHGRRRGIADHDAAPGRRRRYAYAAAGTAGGCHYRQAGQGKASLTPSSSPASALLAASGFLESSKEGLQAGPNLAP